MPRELRLKIAEKYLSILERTGERKMSLVRMSRAYHISQRSVLRYVAEFRMTLCHQ